MKSIEEYYFKPSERIKGFYYILDGNGNFVKYKGKIKKFKTTTACALMVCKLEKSRDNYKGVHSDD